jgi:hypothetical protein
MHLDKWLWGLQNEQASAAKTAFCKQVGPRELTDAP